MNEKFLAALIGIVAGAVGYLVATFWMQPILKYRELRMKVFADFIFYAQVVNAEGLSERLHNLYEERVIANRKSSADLAACIAELPWWYLAYLRGRGLHPDRAASHLIGYSNTTDYEQAAKVMRAIKKALGYPCTVSVRQSGDQA